MKMLAERMSSGKDVQYRWYDDECVYHNSKRSEQRVVEIRMVMENS